MILSASIFSAPIFNRVRVSCLLLFFALCACASPRAQLPVNPENFGKPDLTAEAKDTEDYKFGAFDKFAVTVYRVADLSGEHRVEPSGIVSFPLVGSIKVAGMTTTELEQALETKYAQKYLEHPHISVELMEAIGSDVTVEGSVKTPTVFAIIGSSTLLQAIARAQGPDEYANLKRIVIFRKIDGKDQAAAFDLEKIRAGLIPNPEIYGGDVIVVDGSKLKKAYHDFLQALPLATLFRGI